MQRSPSAHALRFLEKKGLTKTVKDMRDDMKAIDLDSNNRVAFIEFLLFTYKKTTVQMFTAKPSDHLVAMLEEAIKKYKAVFEEKKQKEATMQELTKKADEGDVKAKAELRRLQMEDPAEHVRCRVL